jgi:hypothetical protein
MKRLLMGVVVIAALSTAGSAFSANFLLRAYAAHRGVHGQRETGVTQRPPSAIPDLNARLSNVPTPALNVRDGHVLEFVTPRPPSAILDLNARPPNVATSALNVRDGRVLEFVTPRPPSAIPDLNARPPNVATSALNVRDARVLEFLRWKEQFRANISSQ